LIQATIAYLNTHLIQIVLRDPAWKAKLTEEDRRGLSALFWSHLNLYGRLELDMTSHLADLSSHGTPDTAADTAADAVATGPGVS
jgi:Tn3 transposase DDE domain